VVFNANRVGHIKDESKIGKSICGSELGYHSANDVFCEDGVLYEIEYFAGPAGIIKEDPYNMCKKCLKKIGYDSKKHKTKVEEYGNKYPKFGDFKVVNVEYVEHEI
jgi:hypothetical protein